MTKANFKPRTIWIGDNLDIMRGMNSGVVDMIYLDPPFNSDRNYNNPIDGDEDFKDNWTMDDLDYAEHGELAEHSPAAHTVIEGAKLTQGKGTMAYCIFMAIRILEMKRILNPKTGHLFLHCDDSACHHIRNLLDAIFGKKCYRNHIVWKRSTSKNDATRTFGRNADHIFHYAMPKAKFSPVYEPPNEDYIRKNFRLKDDRGLYGLSDIRNPHNGDYKYEWMGYQPPAKGWCCPERTMQKWHDEGILHYPVDKDGNPDYSKRVRRKRYLSDYKGAKMGNVWTDIGPMQEGDEEFMGYSTQKPPKLMARIIECSTNEGDLVFDPFCGCASLLTAAEDLKRGWAGCDLSPKAVELLIERIVDRKDMIRPGDIAHLEKPSKRDDCKSLPHYRTHKQTLFGMQRGICNGCHLPKPFDDLDVDHLQPQSRSGQDNIENLQLLCGHCNSSKQGKTMAEWNAWRRKNKPAAMEIIDERAARNEREWKGLPD